MIRSSQDSEDLEKILQANINSTSPSSTSSPFSTDMFSGPDMMTRKIWKKKAFYLIIIALVIGSFLLLATKIPIIRKSNQTIQTFLSPEVTVQNLTPSSTVDVITNWKTFTSTEFFSNLKGIFSLRYPSEFTQDFADGPGGSAAVFYTQGFELDAMLIPDSKSSTLDLASAFIQNIINRQPGSLNCDLLPTCKETAFSIREETLANGLIANVASGPSIEENSLFNVYFIRLNNDHILQLYFTFQNTTQTENVKNQILSTFRFLDSVTDSATVVTGSIAAYRIDSKNEDITATFELKAQSREGAIKEMLIWTDNQSSYTWQPFSSFIELPAKNLDQVYVKFKDEKGNISETYSDSIHPQQGPPDRP